MLVDLATFALTALGLFFFVAGTAGLLRFPDTFSRLHALTKADNLGLGCVALGVALQAVHWSAVLKLALIWVLVLLAAGTVAQLVARAALGAARDAGPAALGAAQDARPAALGATQGDGRAARGGVPGAGPDERRGAK